MYVNPFWFGVGIGAIGMFIFLMVVAVLWQKKDNREKRLDGKK